MAIALVGASLLALLQIEMPSVRQLDSAEQHLQNTLTARERYFNGASYHLPSLMRYAYQESLTAVGVTYRWRKQGQRVDIPDGLSARQLMLSAESFVQMSRCITAYGGAGYSYSRTAGVMMLNSSDYALTFPYTSATEAGGEDRRSGYSFTGGCDVALPHGVLGLCMDYRAAQQHRIRDPRPLNIVSDFRGQIGYSLPIGAGYHAAGLVSVDVYKQSSEVRAFNPQDEPIYLVMNGIGSSFQRQYISASPLLYRMHGYGGALALRPAGEEGVWGLVGLTWRRLHRYAVAANAAPINYYVEPSWRAALGYVGAIGPWLLGGRMVYRHSLRRGNDYLLGTSAIREFKILGHAPNYACERIALEGQFCAETQRSGGVRYTLRGDYYRQLQNNPQLDFSDVTLRQTVSGYCIVRFGRQSLRLSALVEYASPLYAYTHRERQMAYRYAVLEKYAEHLAAIHSTPEISVMLGARGVFSLSRRFLFEMGVEGEALRYDAKNLRYAVLGSVRVYFQ